MLTFFQHLFESEGPHDFSSTQVNIPEPDAEDYRKLVRLLIDAGTVKKAEMDPHITVRYGLHTDNADDVREVLASAGRINVTLTNLALFGDSPDHDVLIFNVDSQGLIDLNQRLGILPNTQTYDYHAHLTLAYLNKGSGQAMLDLLEDLPLAMSCGYGRVFDFDAIAFSNHEGIHTILPLS